MSNYTKVVIIDSGVYANHPKIAKEIKGYSINNQNERYYIEEKCDDEFGHGTAVYGIINKHCPEANIIPFKIFTDEQDKANVDLLLYALQYIEDNIECDIINMSVGISILREKEELLDICSRLHKKGIILVAAFDNYGSISYPAMFDCVIGVCESEKCCKNDEFIYVENSSLVNVLANGNMQRCLWRTPVYQVCSGNSFACAHVTGILAKNFQKIVQVYKRDVKEFLKKECKNNIFLESGEYEAVKLNYKGKRAAIFPFNKENHSLIRYEHMLPFMVEGVYDSKYSGRVGAYTNALLKIEGTRNYCIENIEKIDFKNIDLFIIGHTKELEKAMNVEGYSKKLIGECLKQGKQVYSYDRYDEFEENYKNLFFHPNVSWNKEFESPLGKLYRSSTPTLGVFGTTSKQGKFTLQLILRELFLQEGYRVGQIASEPSGLLYEMDYCFPFGYAAKNDVVRKKMVQYLNLLLHKMDEDKDIIIVGCQSATLPYDNGNISDFTFSQIEFLFSTAPDCVILCVNSFDSLDDIERTIRFIESAVKSKVIALVVYPMKLRDEMAGIYSEKIYMSREEKNICISKLEEKFKLPIYILNEKMEDLFERILDFF